MQMLIAMKKASDKKASDEDGRNQDVLSTPCRGNILSMKEQRETEKPVEKQSLLDWMAVQFVKSVLHQTVQPEDEDTSDKSKN